MDTRDTTIRDFSYLDYGKVQKRFYKKEGDISIKIYHIQDNETGEDHHIIPNPFKPRLVKKWESFRITRDSIKGVTECYTPFEDFMKEENWWEY